MPALFAHRTTAPCAGAAERQQLQRRASSALRRSSRPPVAAELAAEAERAGDTEGAVVDAQFWTWRGHRVSYERVSPRRASSAGAAAEASPICVVHGFGSNAKHFRRLTTALAARSGREVFALDQLGFGASDKPALEYTPRLWACQVTDFLSEVVGRPAVLLGNSIGSQGALTLARYLLRVASPRRERAYPNALCRLPLVRSESRALAVNARLLLTRLRLCSCHHRRVGCAGARQRSVLAQRRGWHEPEGAVRR